MTAQTKKKHSLSIKFDATFDAQLSEVGRRGVSLTIRTHMLNGHNPEPGTVVLWTLQDKKNGEETNLRRAHFTYLYVVIPINGVLVDAVSFAAPCHHWTRSSRFN